MKPKRMVASYRTLRLFVGGLGVALPPVLILGGFLDECDFLTTFSKYYHSENPIIHGIFVGTLFAVGTFLICYKGHKRKKGEFWGDNWAANVAGVGALGIAIFPTAQEDCTPLSCAEKAYGGVHDASTLIFLAASTVMVLHLFRKTKDGAPPDDGKKKRNTIYIHCGVVMAVGTSVIVILSLMQSEFPHVLLALEAFVILAFGAAWFVKGLRPWSSD